MGTTNMSAETAAGVSIGLKTGAFAAVGAGAVAVLTVLLGFAIVPLTPGKEMSDAVRRLAAGLVSSFTLGPIAALKILAWFPELLTPWQTMLPNEPALLHYFIASAPVIGVAGLLGFWIVAALMRWFTNRAAKDIGELARDAKVDITNLKA